MEKCIYTENRSLQTSLPQEDCHFVVSLFFQTNLTKTKLEYYHFKEKKLPDHEIWFGGIFLSLHFLASSAFF